jgi:hypothetical protein
MQTTLPLSYVQLAASYAGDQIRAREARRTALAMIPRDHYELRWAVSDAISAAATKRDLIEYRYAVGVAS